MTTTPDREESVEGRFGHLETEVTNLRHGLEGIEKQMSDGFRAVFARMDAVGATRAAGVIPQLALGLTLAGLFAGMIYIYMAGQAGVFTLQMSSMSNDIRETKASASNSLRDVNDRLYSSQFDKGQMQQTVVDFRARLMEVEEKQKEAVVALGTRLDERVKSIDDKISLSGGLQQKANDAAYTSKDEMTEWKLAHTKENAYHAGMSEAKLGCIGGDMKIIEERQYKNTGSIDYNRARSEGDAHRFDLFSQRQYDAAIREASQQKKQNGDVKP